MMEQIESQKVIASGGLSSGNNHLYLSDNEPGAGVELQNFESSLDGGYRRLSGYQPLAPNAENVDTANAEGRIMVVAFLLDTIIVARKQKSGATYKFYQFTGTTWTAIAGQPTMVSTGVTRIRWEAYNFNGFDAIGFVDGVNNLTIYNGTTWTQVKSANTGADFAHAGGAEALNAPNYITVFKNTVWIAQDNVIAYSSPLKDYDWTPAGGSGQMPAGFRVVNITPFRDTLYVFGENNIKKIILQTATDSTGANKSYFALQDVTNKIGCVAQDSVIEINGDLIFLSQDGFRPVEGTARIGDVGLASISKKIQNLVIADIKANDMNEVMAIKVANKSQVRFFFSSEDKDAAQTFGISACLRDSQQGSMWEWFRLKGFSVSAGASKYLSNQEYVIHGDYNGNVYRQETGNSFNGGTVEALYTTPFWDFGNAGIRKTPRKIRMFIKPEGNSILGVNVYYDWLDPTKLNPQAYTMSQSYTGSNVYDIAIYDSSTYGDMPTPVLIQNIQGSGFSTQMKFSTSDTNAPYTIQGLVIDYSVEGKK